MRQLLAAALRRVAARLDPGTQFAGTGTVLNFYGVGGSNAVAVAESIDWTRRTSL